MPDDPTPRPVGDGDAARHPDPGALRRLGHDLNNVMTTIQGYAEILLEDTDPSDARRRDLEDLREATRRASAIVRDLMAFSR